MKVNKDYAEQLLLRLQAQKSIPRIGKVDMMLPQAAHALYAALRHEVECRHRDFRLLPELWANIQSVAGWLTESGKSGLLISGKLGNGKTTLVKALQTLMNTFMDDFGGVGLRIVKARDVIDFYGSTETRSVYKSLYKEVFLAIDDYGMEQQDVLHYGNHAQPLDNLLYHRYEEMLPTILTTNLTPKQLEERVNPRLYDRFREQYEIVIYTTDSYRGE